MEVIDQEFTDSAIRFMQQANKAGKPFLHLV